MVFIASATRCKIVAINDSTGVGLPANQTGELWVKGPQNMIGYLDNKKATDEMLIDGWIRTGDIAYYDDDGFFYITDRLKELIKVKGYQVAPVCQYICDCSPLSEKGNLNLNNNGFNLFVTEFHPQIYRPNLKKFFAAIQISQTQPLWVSRTPNWVKRREPLL